MSSPRIRPFAPDDYGPVAALLTSAFPDAPRTADALRHDDARRDPASDRGRWVAEADGEVVGLVEQGQRPGLDYPRARWLTLVVAPGHRGRGLGARLYEHVVATLGTAGPTRLYCPAVDDGGRGIPFLLARGFREAARARDAHLDVAGFDPAPHALAAAGLAARGIVIRTRDELAGDPGRDHKLHALTEALWRDVPSAVPATPVGYERFAADVLHHPDLEPAAFVVAVDGGAYRGVSYATRRGDGILAIELTGVVRPYRRLGIGLALKLRAIAHARARGYGTVAAITQVDNAAMLALNARLGFLPRPDRVLLARDLGAPPGTTEARGGG
jgi:mycothiol synthase